MISESDGVAASPVEPARDAVGVRAYAYVMLMVLFGSMTAAAAKITVRHGAMPALAATLLIGGLLSLPVGVVAWPGLSSLARISSSAWLALAVLALVITPLGWAFQNLSLRRFEASQVATFSNASPFLTVVWGVWLFDELLTPAVVVGGALTLGGIYWASRSRRPQFNARAFGIALQGQDRGTHRDRHPVAAVLVLSQESAAQ
jgi:drug/metabolite transporter (DMT)-like permease